jgi:hypothetical protein
MMLGYVPADVLPKTYAETILTIVTMFFGFFMAMIFISATTSALQVTRRNGTQRNAIDCSAMR